MIELNKIYQGDCLEIMKDIDDKSIDMILCDLPYSIPKRNTVTGNEWDFPMDIEKLFIEYKRIIKNNCPISLTATNPFASYLIIKNLDLYKYDWVWEKDNGTNFPSINYQPFRVHELILIFGSGATTYSSNKNYLKYNPQKINGNPYRVVRNNAVASKSCMRGVGNLSDTNNKDGLRFPRSIQKINRDKEKLHPTQKPVALFEYLIKTYTNEGELVLDNCIGSGTTAVACINTGRNFIGIEKEEKYCKIAEERIKNIPPKLL